jgi:hypothetical protein
VLLAQVIGLGSAVCNCDIDEARFRGPFSFSSSKQGKPSQRLINCCCLAICGNEMYGCPTNRKEKVVDQHFSMISRNELEGAIVTFAQVMGELIDFLPEARRDFVLEMLQDLSQPADATSFEAGRALAAQAIAEAAT